MKDPREPAQFDFPLMDDSPLCNGRTYRDEEDLYLDEIILDEDKEEEN